MNLNSKSYIVNTFMRENNGKLIFLSSIFSAIRPDDKDMKGWFARITKAIPKNNKYWCVFKDKEYRPNPYKYECLVHIDYADKIINFSLGRYQSKIDKIRACVDFFDADDYAAFLKDRNIAKKIVIDNVQKEKDRYKSSLPEHVFEKTPYRKKMRMPKSNIFEASQWVSNTRFKLIENMTHAESILYKKLEDMGVNYIKQLPAYFNEELHFFDAYIPSCYCIIEADGMYHQTDVEKLKKDRRTDIAVTRLGYTILRYHNSEITDGGDTVEQELRHIFGL